TRPSTMVLHASTSRRRSASTYPSCRCGLQYTHARSQRSVSERRTDRGDAWGGATRGNACDSSTIGSFSGTGQAYYARAPPVVSVFPMATVFTLTVSDTRTEATDE